MSPSFGQEKLDVTLMAPAYWDYPVAVISAEQD
jgi:hypothetical protein